ncbi:unnamed protein product [Rhizoctonia solani]|uniref:BTB domain-containing protein n=1 Tax=Rhizoctonia solani TaxID=456999 RepID=A0A8H3DY83_9AGAM|nr:unnamed protein product [Rhizoctonia solani]
MPTITDVISLLLRASVYVVSLGYNGSHFANVFVCTSLTVCVTPIGAIAYYSPVTLTTILGLFCSMPTLSRAGSMRSTDLTGFSRDEHYYFQDGNIVLLVGNVLFRLHSSLLSRECEMFRNMFSKPTRIASSMSLDGASEMPKKGKEGGCDENPIIMPQLRPQSFRNFLLAVYGRPGDKEFRALFKGVAELESVQAITSFLRIIDIVDLAHRFIAPDVETWAVSQLKGNTRLIETLNAYPISSKSHIRLLDYAKRTGDEELILWARHWARSYYAGAIETSSIASSAFGPAQKIREQLVREYKLATITQSFDTPIFGYLFCFLLSLGHEFWDKQVDLTREDRITLLGAQGAPINPG